MSGFTGGEIAMFSIVHGPANKLLIIVCKGTIVMFSLRVQESVQHGVTGVAKRGIFVPYAGPSIDECPDVVWTGSHFSGQRAKCAKSQTVFLLCDTGSHFIIALSRL
jgi:hypothetical protein